MFAGTTIILIPLITLYLAAAANFDYSRLDCQTAGASSADDTTYASNIDSLLSSLSDKLSSSSSGFANSAAGSSPSTAYGLALCRGDVSTNACIACFSLSASIIHSNCSGAKKAIVWEERCMLRYSNEYTFSSLEINPKFTFVTEMNANSITGAEWEAALVSTLRNVSETAAAAPGGKKFATQEAAQAGTNQVIYSLAQCTPDLPAGNCSSCLQLAMSNLLGVNQAGIALLPGCNLRFNLSPFYDKVTPTPEHPAPPPPTPPPTPTPGPALRPVFAPPPPLPAPKLAPLPPPPPTPGPGPALNPVLAPPPTPLAGPEHGPVIMLAPPTRPTSPGASSPGGKRLPLSVLEIVGMLIFVAIFVTLGIGMWWYKYRLLYSCNPLNGFEYMDVEEIASAESLSLQMDFNQVRAATQNFAPHKKLGEGGFGVVFKGELDNGQEIAVKRLSMSNSEQGVAEFKNEVVLISKLQHQNLVKLIGFCLTGKEKILVYEYLPNSSLDKVLFDPVKRASLDWEKRFNIICGIAKGLLYLHQDSRLRIIHRDLKSSNILLDEAMNPKISDFGIAKMLAVDQTRASTDTIARTYAYMAPEYMLIGQYSLKSDIYSFGILILEIVTGQRNRLIGRSLIEEALLHRAWRLWIGNAMLEMVDSTLNYAYLTEEVVKCIHIGMLCIQVDYGKRPTMTSIVAALNGKFMDLPAPTPPNFFDADYSSSTATTTTTTMGNLECNT